MEKGVNCRSFLFYLDLSSPNSSSLIRVLFFPRTLFTFQLREWWKLKGPLKIQRMMTSSCSISVIFGSSSGVIRQSWPLCFLEFLLDLNHNLHEFFFCHQQAQSSQKPGFLRLVKQPEEQWPFPQGNQSHCALALTLPFCALSTADEHSPNIHFALSRRSR